jgi:hypothetical protein
VANQVNDPAGVGYGPAVTLKPDGTFDATVAGLSASANTVFARACNGTTCAYASQRVI